MSGMAHTSGPPVATDRPLPSTVTAGVLCVALVLGFAVLASPVLLAVALAACAVLVAWGWAGTLNAPTPRGTFGVITLGGLALVLAVGARDQSPWLAWVPPAVALGVVGAFVHQILRKDGRPRVVESVSQVVLALSVVACGALLVPLGHTAAGAGMVLAVLAAAVASSLTDQLGRFPAVRPWLTALALLAGGLAGAVVGLVLDAPLATWLLLGVGAGALSHAMRAVLRPLPTLAHPRPQLVTAVVSVLVVGLLPYLVATVFLPAALPG